MRQGNATCRPARGLRVARLAALAAVLLLATPQAGRADFADDLERIDEGLQKNPARVLDHAREACLRRRNFAVHLHDTGHSARAARKLKTCFRLLKIPEVDPLAKVRGISEEELRARAEGEFERALALEPDLRRGLEIYRECSACHKTEGQGLPNGGVPQIAGQHRQVVIKQLADIRAGHRDALPMLPYASAESIGGPQAVADVAAYIEALEISTGTSKGDGEDLALGAALYREHCVRCHGAAGEGDAVELVPRIQSQHYRYLLRQFEWIRDGKRRNANPEMVEQIQAFDRRQTRAVLDYVSRLEPPEELRALPGWKNPDFAD